MADRDVVDHDHAALGAIDTKPGSATFPFPGVDADIVDNDGNSVGIPGGGYLVLRKPWPAMLRGIYGDPERYKEHLLEPAQAGYSPRRGQAGRRRLLLAVARSTT